MLFRNVGLLLIKLGDPQLTGDMFDQETTETSSSLRPPLKMVGLLRTLQISTVRCQKFNYQNGDPERHTWEFNYREEEV